MSMSLKTYTDIIKKDLRIPQWVKINVKYGIPRDYDTGQRLCGLCEPVVYGTYDITINRSLKKRDKIVTLAHEMRHVWQFYTLRLIHIHNDTFSWKGKIIDTSKERKQFSHEEKDAYLYEVKATEIAKKVGIW